MTSLVWRKPILVVPPGIKGSTSLNRRCSRLQANRRLTRRTKGILVREGPAPTWGFLTCRFALFELPVSMCLKGSDTSTQDFEVNTTLNYTEDQQELGEPVKLYPASEQVDGKQGTEILDNKEDLSQQRKGAKIHDFCLGIPFGGIIFGGGLFGFLFSKTPATSMLSGAAILAMGFISLKIWRQGKSSLPLILGQSAIAATLFWKHFQLYPVTKKIFPSGFYVFISAAMLCFYSYVLIAGGNPPPKKKLAASPSS